jgi:ParB-like chromosome segregation protein Spo0J
MTYPIHPLAKLFPAIDGAEFDVLVASIKANGLRDPITIHECAVLDGRNRQRACKAAGVDATYEPLDSDADPLQFVLDRNLIRRHLTADQKRDLIAKLLKATPEKSNRRIAKAVGVSHPHVGKIRTEMESTGDVETVTTSIDTKGRKQPVKRTQPKQNTASNFGVSEVATTPEKRISGLPRGSTIPAPQAAVVENRTQPANPIIAAWDAATWDAGTFEQRREFSWEHGAAVVDMFMGRGRSHTDPLKYRVYKICSAIELELDTAEEFNSEEIAGLRAEYRAAVDTLYILEQRISDACAEHEEEDAEAAAS